MKKVISVKEIVLILTSVTMIIVSTSAFALDSNLGNNGTTTIPANEYENAQQVPQDNNSIGNNSTGNNSIGNNSKGNNSKGNNSTGNNTKVYNTNNTKGLPQTGIEDYNIGILLIVCIASAIFAYKKVSDYRNI